jgi:hypothetical protein
VTGHSQELLRSWNPSKPSLMNRRHVKRSSIGVLLAVCLVCTAAEPADFNWSAPPWSESGFFPLAVWLQSPANADRYRDAGFNTYIALWKGPTEEQLSALKKAGMRIVCDQNKVALRHLDDRDILAWMHGDEPDNAQELPGRKGYGPPVPPGKIIEDYQRIRAADPSRPVVLNLGQGVAWDGWYGRGVRSNHPEDYASYVKGCDIASFDIYPANHDRKEVAGKLWFVADGVRRLVDWTGTNRRVWNCIECTAIADPKRKPTPQQVRCEVWMSLIHGSRGLIYFVHQFEPTFREATATSENSSVPIALMTKRAADSTYIFAVGMREGKTSATFNVRDVAPGARVEVIGEERTIAAKDGKFSDDFGPWDVHSYRISSP